MAPRTKPGPKSSKLNNSGASRARSSSRSNSDDINFGLGGEDTSESDADYNSTFRTPSTSAEELSEETVIRRLERVKLSRQTQQQAVNKDKPQARGAIQDLRQHTGNRVAANLPLVRAVTLRVTAEVKILIRGKFLYERAILDSSADCSIVSASLMRRWGLPVQNLAGRQVVLLRLRGRFGNPDELELYASVSRGLAVETPSTTLDSALRNNFPGLCLADTQFYKQHKVELVLGADVYARAMRNGLYRGPDSRLLAQYTIFGYVITGQCNP